MPALVDEFISRPDASERHSTVIIASRERVWAALMSTRMGDVRAARPLFAIRRLFTRAPEEPRGERDGSAVFLPLAEDPLREVVLGTIGQWWRLGRGEHRPEITTASEFRDFDLPGYAKGTFSFLLEDAGPGRVRLVTETRVRATSPDARRAFLRYWLVIRLGSGLIRRMILAKIRSRAEALARSHARTEPPPPSRATPPEA
ncbi:hypothetical protein [Nonomuraea rhizosphaerae]|uniref:hypothetical protein n=1 Tax=Nonomuraea rhizosphaerae TaxID=2665663 RepID=UPI001C5F1746|nr:hypothetical protein [Nonomuraea rhizosphaerae]